MFDLSVAEELRLGRSKAIICSRIAYRNFEQIIVDDETALAEGPQNLASRGEIR